MHGATFSMRRLLVVTGLALAGCGSGEQREAAAPPPVPSVGVVVVASRDVTPTKSFNGRVEAVDTVRLLARFSGFLDKAGFTEGKEVKAGDLLLLREKTGRKQQARPEPAGGTGPAPVVGA
jgi:membrane fusion protein, multidrug efflux system